LGFLWDQNFLIFDFIMPKAPNIVFIFADDLGYGDFGCYGATKIPTPNVDRLARQGMRFLDTHSGSAVCTPSRYSLMTGRYCWRTWLKKGVTRGYGLPLIEQGRETIASLLKKHGYHTGAVGKWHLGFEWTFKPGYSVNQSGLYPGGRPPVDFTQPLRGGPCDHGFDYFFGIAGSLDMDPYCFIENDHTVGIPDRMKEIIYNQQRRGLMTADWNDAEVDLRHTEKAKAFITAHVQTHPTQPFFLYLATAAPHRPCECRPEFVIGKSRAGDRGDMVVLFDWVVGQIMDQCDALNITENTLFIVTSDNGAQATCANGQDYGHLANGALRGQKGDIWDGGHREPMIIRWPDHIPAGSTSNAMIGLMDWFATFAALVDEPLTKKSGEDSVNFLPLLTASSSSESPYGYRECIVHHSGEGMFAIRKKNWKLILGLGSGGHSRPKRLRAWPWQPHGQLYDLEVDPKEQHNLWTSHPEIRTELSGKLKEIVESGRSVPLRSMSKE
jgi:arylsulfatase A-like enzyme